MSSANNFTMDPELWGNPPDEIKLSVYQRLPLREFFQLRGVRKEWNLLACQRRGVTAATVRKPYFLFAHPIRFSEIPYQIKILTFHIASGLWKWNCPRTSMEFLYITKPLHGDLLYESFSVKGLIFGATGASSSNLRVFNVHTQIFFSTVCKTSKNDSCRHGS